MTVSDVNGLLLAFRWLHTVVLIPICDEVVLLVTCIKMIAMVVHIRAIGLCLVVGVRDEMVQDEQICSLYPQQVWLHTVV